MPESSNLEDGFVEAHMKYSENHHDGPALSNELSPVGVLHSNQSVCGSFPHEISQR